MSHKAYITLFPHGGRPDGATMLELLTGARNLARRMARAVDPTEVFMATDMMVVVSYCCTLLGTARQAAEWTEDIEVAAFYMEIVELFRGANRHAFAEVGLQYQSPGIWTADARQLTRHVWAFPELSRLFIKHFLREDLEPLVGRWSSRVEMH
jgi:hypothetical protein